MPLTVGGGIKNIEDIESVLKVGADKICINSHAINDTSFVHESSKKFGSQCVTISIDAKINKSGKYEVFIDNGKRGTGKHPADWAKEVELLGAGEILINSIDRDGSRKGFDLKLLNLISGAVNIPVIACGGVGKVEHLSQGILNGNCHGVAAANIFQHTEHSTVLAKAHLKQKGIPIRTNPNVNYDGLDFDHLGRVV